MAYTMKNCKVEFSADASTWVDISDEANSVAMSGFELETEATPVFGEAKKVQTVGEKIRAAFSMSPAIRAAVKARRVIMPGFRRARRAGYAAASRLAEDRPDIEPAGARRCARQRGNQGRKKLAAYASAQRAADQIADRVAALGRGARRLAAERSRDRQGRLLTCEHGGRRVTSLMTGTGAPTSSRTELTISATPRAAANFSHLALDSCEYSKIPRSRYTPAVR